MIFSRLLAFLRLQLFFFGPAIFGSTILDFWGALNIRHVLNLHFCRRMWFAREVVKDIGPQHWDSFFEN